MGARACQVFCRSWGHHQNGLAAAVRRVSASFSFFFWVSQTSSAPLLTPLFCLGVFCHLFVFFLGLGATPHCTCFLGSWPSRLLFGGFLFVFLQKHCFPLAKWGILVHFSVSPVFFSLACFTFPFHSLSLSLYFLFHVSCFFSLFFFLVFWLFNFALFFLLVFDEKFTILHFKRFFA